jgi:hypothetical protein
VWSAPEILAARVDVLMGFASLVADVFILQHPDEHQRVVIR